MNEVTIKKYSTVTKPPKKVATEAEAVRTANARVALRDFLAGAEVGNSLIITGIARTTLSVAASDIVRRYGSHLPLGLEYTVRSLGDKVGIWITAKEGKALKDIEAREYK